MSMDVLFFTNTDEVHMQNLYSIGKDMHINEMRGLHQLQNTLKCWPDS